MGADLNNIVKFQRLSDEHVQFLIYQLLRGLKVTPYSPLKKFEKKKIFWLHLFAVSVLFFINMIEWDNFLWMILTYIIVYFYLKKPLTFFYTNLFFEKFEI